MPIHLPPLSRRGFLASGLAAGLGALLPPPARGDGPLADRFVLLADTHVGSRMDQQHRHVEPAKNLQHAVADMRALKGRFAGAILAGDCAYLKGEAGDYAMLGRLIKPLRERGAPMHFAMGNHDNRDRFLTAFPDAKSLGVSPGIAGKFVSVVETPRANWYLLDSLDKTNVPRGRLGDAQLRWLGKALDARTDKPALVVAHHNPEKLWDIRGMADTAALFGVLRPRRHVKAYVFGHLHHWALEKESGIHLINLPTTAWTFDERQPRGFVTADLRPDGATLSLHCLDHSHPKHGAAVELKWRS